MRKVCNNILFFYLLLVLINYHIFNGTSINSSQTDVKNDVTYETEWERTYGGSGDDGVGAMVQTSDNGFAILGSSVEYSPLSTGISLMKTNSFGEVQWTKEFTNLPVYMLVSLIQTTDEGFAFVNTHGNCDRFLFVKTDENGKIQWNNSFENLGTSSVFSILQTSDEGFILVGDKNERILVIKTDENGVLQWNKTLEGFGSVRGQSITHTSDGGFAVVANNFSFVSEFDKSTESIVIKFDNNGNILWKNQFAGCYFTYSESIIQTKDGGFAFAGRKSNHSSVEDFSMFLTKLSPTGDQEWSHVLGGTQDDVCNSLIQTLEGGFALLGKSDSFENSTSNMCLVITDSSGNLKWINTVGTDFSEGYDLVQTSSNSFVIAGNSKPLNNTSSFEDMGLIKITISFTNARTEFPIETTTLTVITTSQQKTFLNLTPILFSLFIIQRIRQIRGK